MPEPTGKLVLYQKRFFFFRWLIYVGATRMGFRIPLRFLGKVVLHA